MGVLKCKYPDGSSLVFVYVHATNHRKRYSGRRMKWAINPGIEAPASNKRAAQEIAKL